MARRTARQPSFLPFECEARAQGFPWIAGLDEAGRGPLAGPVVAAAVVLPHASRIPGLQDSKRLTARQRDVVYSAILQQAVSYGLGVISQAEIDHYNILWATKAAMVCAVQQLRRVPDMLLIDGVTPLALDIPQQLIIKGDARCASIAAASVLAKVTRDRLMLAYALEYPLYGFDKHKGYPTPDHYARLQRYGPCVLHRRSFRGVLPDAAQSGG